MQRASRQHLVLLVTLKNQVNENSLFSANYIEHDDVVGLNPPKVPSILLYIDNFSLEHFHKRTDSIRDNQL